MDSVSRGASHSSPISCAADDDSCTARGQDGTTNPSIPRDMGQSQVSQPNATNISGAEAPSRTAHGQLPDAAMQRAAEDLAEKEYLNLIRWAVRQAPDLLRVLRIAYLFG